MIRVNETQIFVSGLLAIDMFCDHYVFFASPMTEHQIETCSSYYRNAAQQPPLMSLVTAVPILLGLIVMFRQFRRSIYDKLSIPLFLAVVGVFVARVKPNVESIAQADSMSARSNQQFLENIAYNHAIMSALLGILVVLQLLASKVKVSSKKKSP